MNLPSWEGLSMVIDVLERSPKVRRIIWVFGLVFLCYGVRAVCQGLAALGLVL